MGTAMLTSVVLACGSDAVTQGTPPVKFDSARAYEHLRRQVGFGPRPAGSAALTQTRQYLLAELKAAGKRQPQRQ